MGGYISYALLAALAIALVVAAVTDFRSRTIHNELNIAIAVLAPVYWLAAGLGWVDIAFMLAQAALTFVICCVLFVTRQMGGGDVKLLTAVALWFSPVAYFELIFVMAVLGGGASMAMALLNMQRRPGEMGRDIVAALATGLWVYATAAITFSMATGKPAFGDPSHGLLAALVANVWLLAIAGIALFVTVGLGFLHICRRQKGRLRIPYGIAISAGGLWILAQNVIFSSGTGALTG